GWLLRRRWSGHPCFRVSLRRLRDRDDVPLRLLAAAPRVVAGKIEQHFAPGLLRLLVLAVALEALGGEEQLGALAVQVALAVLDQLRDFGVQRRPLRQSFQVPARLDERLPRIVEVPRRDPPLLQLAPAAVVGGARSRQVTRGDG